MKNRSSAFVFAITIALATAAIMYAQTPMNVKLGLWEVTVSTQRSGMPAMPQVDLSKVPPEQRARVEAMMKQQQGMMAGQPTVTKTCITKEKLEKEFYQPNQADDSCKRTLVSSTASLQDIKIECSGKTKMAGTVRIEAVDNEHVTGKTHFDVDSEGHQMTVASTIAGKWVAADCGGVK